MTGWKYGWCTIGISVASHITIAGFSDANASIEVALLLMIMSLFGAQIWIGIVRCQSISRTTILGVGAAFIPFLWIVVANLKEKEKATC